jgi:hypothetical protein
MSAFFMLHRNAATARKNPVSWMAIIVLAFMTTGWGQETPSLANGGFESVTAGQDMPDGWAKGFGKGTRASVGIDTTVAHGGKNSMRISDQSPNQAFIFAVMDSSFIPVAPTTTYEIKCFVKGQKVGKFFIRADFGGALGEHQQTLPVGDYDWQQVTFTVTTPVGCKNLRVQFVADAVTDALWVDDVSIAVAGQQLANLTERQYKKDYDTWFPRTPGSVAEHLVVADATGVSDDSNMMLAALQGLVNRNGARLYVINRTNPKYYDEIWLRAMQDKGYTGAEERIKDPMAVLDRFRSEVAGVIVYDPEIPGSVNAAWMLAGLKNAIPTSPESAAKFGLPVVEDLRGRFKRNVDAYRYIYDNYWDQMSHFLLAWQHPKDNNVCYRDYIVQWKVFTFWISAHEDQEKGSDPGAEEAFVNELLANTPGNVPVMGWMKHGDKLGIEEYTAARLLSEYGKWIPGTGFSSNVSVHSAIHPKEGTFKQKFRALPAKAKLEPDKKYISIGILDSGDAHWYYQFHQRGIWADPLRGTVPVGFCMNMTMCDTLPLVAQWYYENMTANDSFFGFLYINAPVYASRFREEDRERIWSEYIRLNDEYCRKMDIDGIEIYAGSNGAPAASNELLRRFTRGMKNLNYILAGLGRHAGVTPGNANYMLDDTVVFQTLTNYHIWSSGEELKRRTIDSENAWLIGEIKENAPGNRPSFMSAMAVSWTYYPLWLKDLHDRLPADYVPVSPGEMARLFREQRNN